MKRLMHIACEVNEHPHVEAVTQSPLDASVIHYRLLELLLHVLDAPGDVEIFLSNLFGILIQIWQIDKVPSTRCSCETTIFNVVRKGCAFNEAMIGLVAILVLQWCQSSLCQCNDVGCDFLQVVIRHSRGNHVSVVPPSVDACGKQSKC